MENLRGIGLMILSMAGFASADLFIKQVSGRIPVGEILIILGIGGTLIFSLMAWAKNERPFDLDFFSPLILLRSTGEMIGTFGFITALALTPISSASAIIQATPLAVTLGAALFMQESVGWRRWSAIGVGFFGVLVILHPGIEGFEPASLFAVLAVIGLSIRDLATRAAPKDMAASRLGVYGFVILIPAGLIILWVDGPFTTPLPLEWAALMAALSLDAAGYYALTLAMRMGDVAIITPFRYSRILFGGLIGIIWFGETLDIWMISGVTIVILSGLYTFARERRLRIVS